MARISDGRSINKLRRLWTRLLPGAAAAEAAAAGDSAAQPLPVLAQAKIRRFNQRRLSLFVLAACTALLLLITGGGLLCHDLAMNSDFSLKSLPPSLAHIFGTDWMGRDMLARTLSGLSLSILIGLLASTFSALIALLLGAAAALGGAKVDAAVNWLVDLLLGVPHIVLLILISYALGKGFWGVTVGVALTHWPSLTRVLRSEILQFKQAPYVKIAERLGKSRVHIAVRHLVPLILPQFLVGLILLFPHAILHEAAVTFLGFGLSPEQPAIGVILAESMSYLSTGKWWLAFFPGAALILVVILFDRAGNCLRRLLDPYSAHD